jgi:hypothetical protein
MSLRFDPRILPSWNEHTSCVDFVCAESQSRQAIRCAVSRAALEESTGEELDDKGCIKTFARHLARVIAVANSIYAAHGLLPGGVLTVDSDDLLRHSSVFAQISVAAARAAAPV